MSVRGEVGRTLTDTIACPRELEDAAAEALRAQLERAVGLAAQDLEAAARAVLRDWEASALDSVAGDGAAGSRLRDASERMVAISRIILGHSQVATTEIYAEADQELAVRAIQRIG